MFWSFRVTPKPSPRAYEVGCFVASILTEIPHTYRRQCLAGTTYLYIYIYMCVYIYICIPYTLNVQNLDNLCNLKKTYIYIYIYNLCNLHDLYIPDITYVAYLAYMACVTCMTLLAPGRPTSGRKSLGLPGSNRLCNCALSVQGLWCVEFRV